MRVLLAVAILGVLVVGSPTCAESSGPGRTVEVYHSAGEEFGMALGASLLSAIYAPVRLVYGIVGAELGGIQGFLTGGNQRAANGAWRVTVEGDYYIRPEHFDGAERFEVINIEPVIHDRYIADDPDF